MIAEGPHNDVEGYTPGVAVVATDVTAATKQAQELWPSLPKKFKRVDPPREMKV